MTPKANCNAKKARIGDKSSPPIGGRIFLKGAKIGSEKSCKNLKGCLYQSMLGNQVSKILRIKMM